mmetsp:Transcript_3798/g.10943  ORF Transcript_3798/g.10943 Transcript_3798/m.10943 type:complete len:286 (+) Transcript_3798:81-938(+)
MVRALPRNNTSSLSTYQYPAESKPKLLVATSYPHNLLRFALTLSSSYGRERISICISAAPTNIRYIRSQEEVDVARVLRDDLRTVPARDDPRVRRDAIRRAHVKECLPPAETAQCLHPDRCSPHGQVLRAERICDRPQRQHLHLDVRPRDGLLLPQDRDEVPEELDSRPSARFLRLFLVAPGTRTARARVGARQDAIERGRRQQVVPLHVLGHDDGIFECLQKVVEVLRAEAHVALRGRREIARDTKGSRYADDLLHLRKQIQLVPFERHDVAHGAQADDLGLTP